ncbi:hypothetical protein [Agrobacterium vitis]|uniref:hypothetical protein n=1 Tax=Agrobacterium vitis TaxID=373 RepID=UPI0012EA6960|nr:hypothetical protein [Agrobacterium vitis]MUO69182.1 hypothetical protein [Agrobacterium vitis]
MTQTNPPAETGSPQPRQESRTTTGKPQSGGKIAPGNDQTRRGRNGKRGAASFGRLRDKSSIWTGNAIWPNQVGGPTIRKPLHGTLKCSGRHIGPAIRNSVKGRAAI